jgi:hypothetical protein
MTWQGLAAAAAMSNTQQGILQDIISCSHCILVSHPCLAKPGSSQVRCMSRTVLHSTHHCSTQLSHPHPHLHHHPTNTKASAP